MYGSGSGAFVAVLGCVWPAGHGLDAPGRDSTGLWRGGARVQL